MYFLYMLKNNSGKLYIGISKDPGARLKDHNSGRGAKFTKGKAQYKIVFLEKYETLSEARCREIQLKKWRRSKKEMLISLYQRETPTNRCE